MNPDIEQHATRGFTPDEKRRGCSRPVKRTALLKIERTQRAEDVALAKFPQVFARGKESLVQADGENAIGRLGGESHFCAILRCRSHGFLAKHMPAPFQRSPSMGGVKARRRGDDGEA